MPDFYFGSVVYTHNSSTIIQITKTFPIAYYTKVFQLNVNIQLWNRKKLFLDYCKIVYSN